ncbi:hypothetical protein POSPLADRAFT_1139899 [Postia placenta MAD-698-R-SB12]|uniref:HNH nuclease domain-containing protein n=1 Tax=Postia placenta MAD-698-R-SB12 TaxID=670580 RepID=A0A1X6N5I4_9APHY|nr:hypothetical protein POSPLADRAFT_1139899 [Postia placenta MAD-698-R-SB12]OSX63683.1 hypothetical protein POSPLADRAFT_1139899 [Postia placenta MAD-698-R-SB12]
MNVLAILIPDMFYTRAAEHLPRESTPALSDDTGSSSSRESSPPATPVSGLSRAPSISFDDNSKHIPTGDGTDIKILEPDADSSPPEDITRPLKRRRLADTRADEFRSDRALSPDTWSDATEADDGVSFGSGRVPISDCTSVGDVKPDAVDPSLEYVFRPSKRKRCADTRTDDACAKRERTSGTSSDAIKAEDSASFGLGHILVRECTSIRFAESNAVHAVSPRIDLHTSLEAIARPPKRKRCAHTTTDEVRVKRRRLSDSPSDASKLKDGGPYGPHPRCMITGCVSAEVEACYILPPDTHQPLGDCTTLRMPTDSNAAYCSTPANIIFLRRDLRILWDTNRLLMIPHPDHIDYPDTRPAYKYYVIAEDEHPLDSCIAKDYTITPPVATACSSYRSLGWHDLSANLHLMTIRVGRELMKRPLHYENHLVQDALSHIPTITPVCADMIEPVFSHIKRDSPVEGISRLPKRKRSPDIETDEVPAKRMRTSGSARNTSKVEDSVPFGPHPRCMITGCVSADVEACYILPPDMPQLLVNRKMDYITFNMRTNYNDLRCPAPGNFIFLRRDLRELWETNRLLMIPHPDHLQELQHCTVYKYCIIAEEEHPPDSCATMGYFVTPSVMKAPCSYRSLGWHELNANLRLMIFRAGQKLSKRPLHYQHVLRDLLPHKEINHAYTIIQCHGSWTARLSKQLVPERRLWATGELSACPDGYYRRPVKQYCSPLLDDDAYRFPRRFRPIVSGIKRKRSGDTSVGTQTYTVDEHTQREVSVRQWCLDCDHARDEWKMGPPAEPEDAEMLAYRQEQAGDVLAVTRSQVLIPSPVAYVMTGFTCPSVLTIQHTLSENDPCWRTPSTRRHDWSLCLDGVILASRILPDEPNALPDRAGSRSVEYKNYKHVGSSMLIVPANHLLRLPIPQLPAAGSELQTALNGGHCGPAFSACLINETSDIPEIIMAKYTASCMMNPYISTRTDDFVATIPKPHVVQSEKSGNPVGFLTTAYNPLIVSKNDTSIILAPSQSQTGRPPSDTADTEQ